MSTSSKYHWVATWDAAGVQTREAELAKLIDISSPAKFGIYPGGVLSQVQYTPSPPPKPGTHSIPQPAWQVDSKVVFGLSPASWSTPELAAAWLETSHGKAWMHGSLGFTLIHENP